MKQSVIQKILDLRREGKNITFIAWQTEESKEDIKKLILKHRIVMPKKKIIKKLRTLEELRIEEVNQKKFPDKYGDLIYEKKNEGKDYKQYLKNVQLSK